VKVGKKMCRKKQKANTVEVTNTMEVIGNV